MQSNRLSRGTSSRDCGQHPNGMGSLPGTRKRACYLLFGVTRNPPSLETRRIHIHQAGRPRSAIIYERSILCCAEGVGGRHRGTKCPSISGLLGRSEESSGRTLRNVARIPAEHEQTWRQDASHTLKTSRYLDLLSIAWHCGLHDPLRAT